MSGPQRRAGWCCTLLTIVAGVVMVALVPAAAWAEERSPALVPASQALAAEGEVWVAGTVRPETLREIDRNDMRGYSFELVDPTGTLVVLHEGKKPAGLEVAPVVVVAGTPNENVLRARQVFVPGATAPASVGRGLAGVAAVTLIVWLGLFAYVVRLHLRLRQLEETTL
jgi:CcmD family protein